MVSHSRKVRFSKTPSGKYVIQGKSYEMLEGSRAQVWHNTAFRTSGGLKKSDLLQNKAGRIVSKSKHSSAKHDNRLVKAGYGTKKGTFGYVLLNGKKGKKSPKRKSSGRFRKQSGGMMPLNPAPYNGQGVGTSGVAVQFEAGMGGRASSRTRSRSRGRSRSRRRSRSGGMMPLNPNPYKAMNPATSGDALQFLAGNSG